MSQEIIHETINHPLFGDFKQGLEVLNYLETYMSFPRGFLLLAGKNGTGKTHAAKVIYHANTPYKLPFKDVDRAFFINQADLNAQVLKQSRGTVEYFDLTEVCKNTKLLVLDDIGTRIPSDFFMDFLYAIVDKRYNENLGTIITTNLNAADMREKFGDAFVSRVASGKCFRFTGSDRRFKDF